MSSTTHFATEGSVASHRPILLVDDDDDAHFFMRRSLKKLGISMQVHEVHGGKEAIAYLERCVAGAHPYPAIVFLDIKMPGTNGFDVLKWIQERNLTRRMPVVMLSSSDDPRDLAQAMGLGANCYFTKPPPPELLRTVVDSAARVALDPAATPVAGPAAPGAPAVLVVDDSPTSRRASRALLEELGYQVFDAPDGETAMQFCRATPPMLVLLDWLMPTMDGREIARRLREMRSNLRMIVLSSEDTPEARAEAAKHGVLGFVAKPATREKLIPAIAEALSLPQWG